MRDLIIALRVNLLFIVLTGFCFPLFIDAASQILFPFQANGSLIKDSSGKLLGSEIIGQQFTLPKYFHPRPSAAGSGYDAANSSGTNLGPTSSKWFIGLKDDPTTSDTDESYSGVQEIAIDYRNENALQSTSQIPIDAVTRSASGLDPHISPANALVQAERVAKSRTMDIATVSKLIHDNTETRFLGIFGEPRVNVLRLNMALDKVT